MNMAEKIKKCRKQSGLTQIELAKKIGISPMTIRRWEWGERNPDIAFMPKLADALNTSVQYLMGLQETPSDQGDTTQMLHAPNASISAGISGKSIVIRDTNSHQEIEIPNDAEGRKLFLQLFSGLFNGFGSPAVSNSINGNNNSGNLLGISNARSVPTDADNRTVTA